MSSLVFPTLAGLGWDIVRTPEWYTEVTTSLSGKTSAINKRAFPLIHWELRFNLLREVGAPGYSSAVSELLQVVGHFNSVQGRFDSWLYSDPDFNSVTGQLFGVGDGVTKAFQLVATYQNTGGPGYNELVQNINNGFTLNIYDNAVLVNPLNYAIGPTGIVTFTVAPIAAHALTWDGHFYYRCRFDDDSLKLNKMMSRIWELQKLAFTSVKL